ncbi:MAG: PAS domain S-box protein [Proteobacteria bacterium]|nr:PAS domain S-box protein [Pseudomonadota bacterium]
MAMTADKAEELRRIEVLQYRVLELEETLRKYECSTRHEFKTINPPVHQTDELQRGNDALLHLAQFTIHNAMDAAYWIDSDMQILYVNDSACKALGYSREELLTMSIADIDPNYSEELLSAFRKEFKENKYFISESIHKRKDGSVFPVEIAINDIPVGDRKYHCTFARDITERKQAELERLASLKFFESMDKINRAIQVAQDPNSMISGVLDIMLSVFDCDRAILQYPCDPEAESWEAPMISNKPEYPRISTPGIMIPMDTDIAKILRTTLDSNGPFRLGPGSTCPESSLVLEGFGLKSFMMNALYPKVGKPWLFGIQQCSHARVWTPEEEKLFQEIGRRLTDALTSLLTYRNLVKSEEFLSNILENIPYIVIVKDAYDLRYLRRNKASEHFAGRPNKEVIGKTNYDLLPKEIADAVTANDYDVLRNKKLVDIPEVMFRNKDNEKRILHTKKIPLLDKTGTPQYLLIIAEDITDHKKLEAQLRQAQKMDAIGRLAGGVAHDFNNMIGVIIGHADLCLEKLDISHPFFDNLKEIQTAAQRSANLTRQLLAFARKQTITPRILDLNETVEGMLKMLRRLIGEDIDLAWLPDTGIWPVKMDPSQIDQILANLCVNARDSIPGVGKITISTENITIDKAYCNEHAGFVPGEFVLLTVSDNGSGMDKKILSNLFEPFFTTKAKGKGTGLGLATAYGIVKQNNGFINVYSEPGQGSTFKIYLPRQAAHIMQTKKKQKTAPALQGNETVLLVEDESALLDMGKEILEILGYKVLAASTPQDAIRIAEADSAIINLIITDVVLPSMNGPDLARKIMSIHPDIKCLFTSGYTSDIITHHSVLDEGVNFIQKPFSLNTLAAKVREVIDNT